MPGKHIFLSIFLFVILFQITLSKSKDKTKGRKKNKKNEVDCWIGKDNVTPCKFNPTASDGPDLSKCKKGKCHFGCGRTYVSHGIDGISEKPEGPMDQWTNLRVKRFDVGGALADIELGCITEYGKDSCKKMTPKEGLCVCQKKLCNSATNIAPATFIFLLLWIIGLTR